MCSALDDYLSKHGRLIVAQSADECITVCHREFEQGFYFRGMSNVRYEMLSSLDRVAATSRHMKYVGDLRYLFHEQWFQREFRKTAHNHLSTGSLPSTRLEWLALMQHFGVPTRLVDLTRSPYVALYFAVRDWQSENDAVVWAIGEERLHKSSFHRLKAAKFSFPVGDPEFYEHNMLEFLDDRYFDEAFLSGKHSVAMILEPKWSSARLAAQQGAFLVTSAIAVDKTAVLMDFVSDESYINPEKLRFQKDHGYDISLRKLVIKAEHKRRVLKNLHRMNISSATLFPGIEGSSQGLLERGALEDWESSMDRYKENC